MSPFARGCPANGHCWVQLQTSGASTWDAAAGKLLAHELLHTDAEILQDLLHVCGGAEFQQLLVILTQPGFTYTLVAGVFQLAALSQLMALLLWTA